MNNQEIVEFLRWTGHLEYPHGKEQGVPSSNPNKVIESSQGLNSVASYQAFEAEQIDRLCLREHSRPARFDGEIGPATIRAMQAPRCGCQDYGPKVQPATGSGSWKGCHDIGDFHSAKVRVDKSGMPAFLAPFFGDVWSRMEAAYMDIGLKFYQSGSNSGNIDFSFVSSSRGWIGLAVVGQQESCNSNIWCKFLARYQPANVLNEWTTLIMHELGHNAGLHHSRGGVMNPSIVQGLAPTWRGDPSESILVRYYGGVPIEPPPTEKEYWTMQGLKSNLGRTQWVPLAVPIPIE